MTKCDLFLECKQGCIQIWKSISMICHTNRAKEKNHMIILTDAEKVPDNIEYLHDKRLHMKGPQGTLCSLWRLIAFPGDQEQGTDAQARLLYAAAQLWSPARATSKRHAGTEEAELFMQRVLRLPHTELLARESIWQITGYSQHKNQLHFCRLTVNSPKSKLRKQFCLQ